MEQVLRRCQSLGSPRAIARLACHAYRAPRHLSLGGNLSAALYAIRGVVAGCPFAAAFIRVNSVNGLDSIIWPPSVTYPLYT
eukprot:208623-Pyramimonas_sp.AAC.1